MKHYKSVEFFLSIFRISSPLNKRKAPLSKTFWRRFWAWQAASNVFQVFGMTGTGIEYSLPALVWRARPKISLSLKTNSGVLGIDFRSSTQQININPW